MSDKLVLVVDDDPDSRYLIQRVVEGMVGIPTTPAKDGEEALKRFREVKPNLVLLDLTLPKLNGFEVARRLKADPATEDTPVIAVSGLSHAKDKQLAREAGCDDYIVKPFRLKHLADKVRGRLLADGGVPRRSAEARRASTACQGV